MDKLGAKNYQKLEKQYMIFGSLCNGLQNVFTEDNYEEIAQFAWDFAKKKNHEIVEGLYKAESESGNTKGY